MALMQDDRTVNSLIQLTSTGLDVADYPTIKRAILKKYQEIYGSDIDISDATADGVFVETLSLMIFNILQNVKFLYSNLDIRTASGTFLESLCALTGVYRKEATKSRAQLELTNLDSNSITIGGDNQLEFIDQSGITWSTNVSLKDSITIESNKTLLVDVYCNEVGPISAPVGWINQLIDNVYSLTINQINSAVKGSYKETDGELRSRRNEIISSQGLSVLSSLRGALFNISGIEDVVIYNNPEITNATSLDDTTIKPKSIYVVLRKKDNVQISDSKIGSTIYEKLTPGINTSEFDGQSNTGESKMHNYLQTSYLGEGSESVKVYWKEAKGINEGLSIEISYKPGRYFSTIDDNTLITMRDTLQQYLNNLSINKEFTTYDLISLLNDEDSLFNNEKTYNVIDVKLASNENTPFKSTIESGNLITYQTKDTYFNIHEFNEYIKDDNNTIKKVTFTVKN